MSIRMFFPLSSVIRLEQRVRLFLGLSDVQVEHKQPITGVPELDPTPRNVICMWRLLDCATRLMAVHA